jgi:hypothetical protein
MCEDMVIAEEKRVSDANITRKCKGEQPTVRAQSRTSATGPLIPTCLLCQSDGDVPEKIDSLHFTSVYV